MELKLQQGDYVPDGAGGLWRVDGPEAVGQRVIFKLTARRGQFPFQKTLGSRLWQLGKIPAARRQAAAEQYVAEALSEERELTVERVTLREDPGGLAELTVELRYRGETLLAALEVL